MHGGVVRISVSTMQLCEAAKGTAPQATDDHLPLTVDGLWLSQQPLAVT